MPLQLLPVTESVAPSNRPFTDCRVFERLSCELPTTCQPASALEMKEMRWSAIISDISLGGVRLILSRRFEKNTGLAIELPGTEERDSTVVFVKVVHVRAQGNGTWALGCKFLSELSEDQLQSLLTSANRASGAPEPEQSVDNAPPADLPTVHLLSNVRLVIETKPGTVVHCIIKRFNATKCWPLMAGKVLSLSGKTPDKTPWTLRIQIAECSSHETGWNLQGRLVGSVEAAKLLHSLSAKSKA
jgi:PilZ domain